MQSIYAQTPENMAKAVEYLSTVEARDLDTFCLFVSYDKDLDLIEEESPETSRSFVLDTVNRILSGWRAFSAEHRFMTPKRLFYKEAIEARLSMTGMDDEEFAKFMNVSLLLATTICAMFGIS